MARPPVGHPRGRRTGGAGPVERRAVPGRGAGHRGQGDRARLAARDHPGRRRAARDRHADGRPADLADDGLTVTGPGTLHGIDYDLHDVGELTPAVAALCLLADAPSHLRGIAHIRGHETDRLAALATEFNGLGGHVTETEDGLTIRPTPRCTAAPFRTYADHRMAHAGVILGLGVDGVVVEDIATTVQDVPRLRRCLDGAVLVSR